MRVLFTIYPATGHFHPIVPIIKAVEARGHAVALTSSASFAPVLESNGFRVFPVGIDGAATIAALPSLRTLSGDARDTYIRTHMFPGFSSARMLPDILDLATVWSPDLVVWDNCVFAGAVAAEAWGIPHASVKTLDWYGHYPDRFEITSPLGMLRAFARLPPDPDCAMQFRYLHFILDPPQFQRADQSLAPTTHRLRRVAFDQSGNETLPAWVSDLPTQPTVYATLGTEFNRRPEIFAAILDALRDEPLNLIVTLGRDKLAPEEFGPQPANVRIERYIPQSLLLRHCDLVISHGGSGTVMAALDEGLPLINIPMGGDQPGNAARCVDIGVGLSISAEERTPEAIRAAAREVLTNPTYRANAEGVRDEMAALPGPEYAVELLERLAVERQPLVHGV